MRGHERSRSSQDRREGGPSAVEHPLQQDEEYVAPSHASLAAEHQRLAKAEAQRPRATENRRRREREHQDCQNFNHIRHTSSERNERVPKVETFLRGTYQCHNAFPTHAALRGPQALRSVVNTQDSSGLPAWERSGAASDNHA
jgi:hypothetical protein